MHETVLARLSASGVLFTVHEHAFAHTVADAIE